MSDLIQLQTLFDPRKQDLFDAMLRLSTRIRPEEVVKWKGAAKENQVGIFIPRLIEPVGEEEGRKKLSVRCFVMHAMYERDLQRELLHFLP